MSAPIIFLATFVVVLALGFQSLTVNAGHYRAAFLNSFFDLQREPGDPAFRAEGSRDA